MSKKLSPEEALAAFKAEFCTEGSIVLDAWLESGFIQVYIDGLRMDTDEGRSELDEVPAPGEYEGMPTMLVLFPRDED